MKIEEIEIDLIKMCEAAIAKGWVISDCLICIWDNMLCCPLGALHISDPEVYEMKHAGLHQIAFDRYGMLNIETLTFIQGFDNRPYGRPDVTEDKFYQLGQRLRKKYIK